MLAEALSRSGRNIAAGVLCAIALALGQAHADPAASYPSRPVKLVVPFPGGGPLDFTARLVAEKLAAAMRQSVVVENRPGASGNLGTELVSKATADGYTLLFTLETPLTVSPSLYPELPFNSSRDFTAIATAARFSMMLAVHPSMPVNSLAEFVDFAKAHHDRPILYGSGGGRGDPGHLTMEYFRLKAGFEAVHVPYKGNAEVVTNLAGGHVLAGFLATPGILPQVRAGRVKALASSGLERLSFAPEVPTISENGYPGFDVGFYEVMMAPARLPEPIRAILEREVKDALQAPDLQARLRDNALDPVAYGSVETTALLKAAAERWHSVITRANIRLD